MKSHVRLLTLASLAVFAAACSGGTEPEDIFGRYVLDSIGAEDLPERVFDGFEVLDITAGYFELEADETCLLSLTSRSPEGGPTSTELDTCTFFLVEQLIFLTWSDGTGSTGTVIRDQVTLTLNNTVYLFIKR